MLETEKAQKGNRFKTRIVKVNSPPIVTYAGRKVYTPERANPKVGTGLFNFLIDCQKEFEDRNVMKTSFDLDQCQIKKVLNNLPRINLSRYFWYVNYLKATILRKYL